ncbi:NEQ545 [Nanoarchaeum equitans Kin4-M]|uniref:NEQ545 n=1 Tax=Nanoarchaeum equitans (strain Kin4-M) TaxID=228908 RepID=Q74M48_NANEQ|nr:NEQ545 [Nanoarchaeum equitans Kin4-M]
MDFEAIAKKFGLKKRYVEHLLYYSYFYKPVNFDKIEIPKENLQWWAREILKLQRPTKERLPFYEKIWEKHKEFSDTIIDIGSGLNPISLLLIDWRPKEYIALDIADSIVNFLNKLDFLPIKAKKFDFLSEIPKEKGLILLWKVIPIMDKFYGFRYVKNYLESLRGNIISISFPRKSLSGKKLIGRAWRYYIKRASPYKIIDEFETDNEYFIIFDATE